MQTPKKKVSSQPEVRSLKIQPVIKFNQYSQTTIPVIKLSGHWLGELGFTPDQRVKVTAMNKLLIISLDED